MERVASTASLISSFLRENGWTDPPAEVRFLAAGEYNENYLVRTGDRSLVFRINHGSQLGLRNQIEYEYRVLTAVKASGVTPEPIRFEPDPGDGLGNGVLLMEYLPGRPLDYGEEHLRAADVFARIHRLPISDRLLRQDRPMLDVAAESEGLLTRYPDHPLTSHRDKLMRLRDHIVELSQKNREFFAADGSCIANTEVNNGNFLVDDGRVFLVDWEKAVVTSRYQDLGHFLVPTTTLWKGNYVFDDSERRAFLSRYKAVADLDVPLDDIDRGARLMESTIILRGLSWCYMAYYEYTQTDRQIRNQDTFETIESYMKEIDWFLERGYRS